MTCIFISYSSTDRTLAEQTHAGLKQLGYRVWRDKERIEIDWSRELSQALVQDADLLCLLWTPHAAKSKWVQHEWLTARALEKRIIPCIHPNAPPLPPGLDHLHGIVIGRGTSLAQELHRRLKMNPALHVEYDFSVGSKNAVIPFKHNRAFVGRRGELAALYQKMVGDLDKTGVSLAGLVGMGGMGKTQMAIEFVFRYSFAFQAVYWIQAGNADRWFESLVHLARTQLPITIENPDSADADFQYFSTMRKYFGQTPQVLLVFDNVEDPQQLASEYVMAGTHCPAIHLGCSVLFTTRTGFDLPSTTSLQVGQLPADASFRLLTRGREPADSTEIEHAHVICNILGYLPLALVLANGLLRVTPSASYADYRSDLADDLLGTVDFGDMTEEELATRHLTVIEKTLRDQIATLEDETAHRLLELSSLFADAEWIPKEFLGHLGGIAPGRSRTDRPLDRAVHRLLGRSLLEEVAQGSAVRLHPLLKAVLRNKIGPEEERTLKREDSRRVAEIYSDFQLLEVTYLQRGIDQLLIDLATAVVWGHEGGGGASDLYRLYRVLSQASSDLRTIEPDRRAAHFSQQVGIRATQFGLDDLKQKAEARQAELGGHRFTSCWVSGHGMPSLLRTMDTKSRELGSTVALSSDGRYAVTGGSGGSAIIWLTQLGVIHHDFRPHEETIVDIAFLGSTRRFATASASDTIEIWNADATEKVYSLPGNLGGVISIAVTPDGKRLFAACGDGIVRVWNLEALPRMREFSTDFRSSAAPICVRCCGERIVVLYDDDTCRVGYFDDEEPQQFECEQNTRHMTVSGRGDYACMWGVGQFAIIVDLDTCTSERVIETRHPIIDVAIAADAGLAVLSEFFGAISLLSWLAPDTPKRLLGTHGHGGGARLTVSSDGSTLASVAYDDVKIWNPSEVWQTVLLPGHHARVSALAKLPSLPWFASASWDGTVKVWDTGSGKMLRDVGKDHDLTEVLALDPAGTAIAGGVRETIVWDLENTKVLRKLDGATHSRIRYARDGSKIVLTLFQGVVSVTDTRHGSRTLGEHKNQLLGLALVGDDRYAVTGAGDGTLVR